MIRYGRDAKIMSAVWVSTPAATASSEYRGLSEYSMSESDRTMWVEERCTIVVATPASQSAAQMSCAELFEPMTTAFLPT
jgi:hypothetical protein